MCVQLKRNISDIVVSSVLTAIASLVVIGVVLYTVLILSVEQPEIEKLTPFVDFSLKQEGPNILIQNTGIKEISTGSLKVYSDYLLKVTNNMDIPVGSTYTIKLSELPTFEGKKNITVALGNINKYLEITYVVEVTTPISQVYPPRTPEAPKSAPTVKIYFLLIDIAAGEGNTTPSPNVYEYEEGTEVEVNATPHKNYTLGYWFFDGNIIFNTSVIVRMDKNHSLKPAFLIRSDVDCARKNPTLTIKNATPQSNISMTYTVNATNTDFKCGLESFELSSSCRTEFICSFRDIFIQIDSGNSSTTTDFFMRPKNVTELSAGNYSFEIIVTSRADRQFSGRNSSAYEIK